MTISNSEIHDYLKGIDGMILEESDKSIKFSVSSQEEYDTVVGYFFLLGLNVGSPRDSSVIPEWKIGRIYKNGESIDEEEEKKF